MKYMFLATFVIVVPSTCTANLNNNKKSALGPRFYSSAPLGWYCSPSYSGLSSRRRLQVGWVMCRSYGARGSRVDRRRYQFYAVACVLCACFLPQHKLPTGSHMDGGFSARCICHCHPACFQRPETAFVQRDIPSVALLSVGQRLANCFAFYQLVSNPCLATVATFAGAQAFFASTPSCFLSVLKRFRLEKPLSRHADLYPC